MDRHEYIIKGNYLLFWNSHFSNWFPSLFIVNGIRFNCVEQYMMYMKAKTFNDHDAMEAIMATTNPKEQKQLGRGVKNFDPIKWDEVKEIIVFNGCLAKYCQDFDLKKDILDTKELILVEASPYDKIWGIGLPADHPDATDESKWQGENLLGKALMKVRSVLNETK